VPELQRTFPAGIRILTVVPQSALCHYNRALPFDTPGSTDEAFQDYTRPIQFAPDLAAALRHRRIVSYQTVRYLSAISDRENVLRGRRDHETLGRVYCNLALAQLVQGDRARARSNADKAADLGCEEARVLCHELL